MEAKKRTNVLPGGHGVESDQNCIGQFWKDS